MVYYIFIWATRAIFLSVYSNNHEILWATRAEHDVQQPIHAECERVLCFSRRLLRVPARHRCPHALPASSVGVPKTISPSPCACLIFNETVGPFGKGAGFSFLLNRFQFWHHFNCLSLHVFSIVSNRCIVE